MANQNPNTEALKNYHKERSNKKHDAVEKAIKEALSASEAISIAYIAKKAGVSREFIRKTPHLKEMIEENRANSSLRYSNSLQKARENARFKSLENKLSTVTSRCKKQAQEIKALKDENLKLKLYIENLADSNIVPLKPKSKKS